jgi:hypothetical protein
MLLSSTGVARIDPAHIEKCGAGYYDGESPKVGQ